MIANEIPVDIFRGNHTYQLSGMDDITGMLIRLLMYLVSFVMVLTFLALIPDVKLPVTFPRLLSHFHYFVLLSPKVNASAVNRMPNAIPCIKLSAFSIVVRLDAYSL